MEKDQWGYPVATNDAKAAKALDQAFDAYVGFRTDTMSHVEAAIAADPQFALPHAVRGILIAGMRKPELYQLARDELTLAQTGNAPLSDRENHYTKALEAVLLGKITAAVSHYEQILLDHPRDLFALRLAQFELFWIGEVAWMRDISERVAPHWSADMQGYSAIWKIFEL